MSSDYSYDEHGQFFPFFILTVTGLVTIPLTYTLVRSSTDDDKLAPRIKTDYRAQNADAIAAVRATQQRKQRRLTRFLFALGGWVLMGAMVYLILVTQPTVQKIWNPYDILGISDSASEKQIKSHYRQLGKKYHPDKARPDPAKNETLETINQVWVELSKAYQALTDEEVRNNYIQFGHPDGKQSFSIGIALPKFIVEDGNGKYVVLLYTLLLGVLLPYMVGSWWYGTQRMSKEGVLMSSANKLFRRYEDEMDEAGAITALSSGDEYADLLKGDKADSGLAKIESRIAASSEVHKSSPYVSGIPEKEKERLEDMDNGPRRKALALLWAYLGRVELDDAALNQSKYEVAPIARALRESFAAISLAYGNTKPILTSYYTAQNVVQAVAPNASPLLQLPHITPEIANAIEGDSRNHFDLQDFLDQSDSERRKLAVGKDLLSEDQYKTVLNVGQQLPYLRVAKAFFKVTGEKYITPASLVTLVIKGRFIPPGAKNVPKIHEDDLEDIDPAEDDLDAINGKKQIVKGPDGKLVAVEKQSILPPMTFAPHYPRDQSPKWHAFLSDSKQGKMAVPPFTFAKFDQPIFDAQGKPTFAMQTLKAQFAAPPQEGHYTFVLHLICDSYIGFDTKMEVTLVVEEANKAVSMSTEDEISEPDEDSLAGQMQALKGGAPPPKPRRRPANDDDSSDEESGTDDEEEDDTSATNTDTEDES
ncbi:unnamed protein product [Clonostachys rhizophaga]|uniref:J domain-containing protein n=1 Tax=Clonostachys rhizophaga TaxID=160324 RepID=A0A9N9YN77_9HYPO|nr:unnamed protein product [Clonostachys rhizophaga]